VSTNRSVRERLLPIFRKVFDDGSLDESVSTGTCAAWDSLGHIKLLVVIEQEFRFEPSPDEIMEMYANFKAVEGVVSRKRVLS